MLDRLRCRYGRYICTVKFSTDSSNDTSGTDCWLVSYEEDNGQSVRYDFVMIICINVKRVHTYSCKHMYGSIYIYVYMIMYVRIYIYMFLYILNRHTYM